MRILTSLVAAAVLLGASSAQGAGTVYNAAKQYSAASNLGSMVWTYRYNTTAIHDGNYPLLPNRIVDTRWSTTVDGTQRSIRVPFWTTANFPSLSGNPTKLVRAIDFGLGPVNWPADTIYVHPAATGSVVLSFRAPKDGTIAISYSFSDIDPHGGDGVNWYVDRNAGTHGDLASGTLQAPSTRTTGSQHLTVAIKKGQHINFIVDAHGNNDNAYDSTVMKALVAYQ
jgi:hypothetical protein